MSDNLWRPEKPVRKSRGFIRGDSFEGWEQARIAGGRAAQRGAHRIDNPMQNAALRAQWYAGFDAEQARLEQED